MGVYLHDGGDSPEDDCALENQLKALNNEVDELTNMLYEVRASVVACSETVTQMAQHIADKEGKGVGIMFDLPLPKKVKK